MDSKTKKDILATIILIMAILGGVACGYFFELHSIKKDGSSFILGFFLGVLLFFLITTVWSLIRVSLDD